MNVINSQLVLLCVLTVAFSSPLLNRRQTRDVPGQYSVWNAELYPDPQLDIVTCNRTTSALLCDPDNLLDEKDAQKLDLIISNIKRETGCACATCEANPGITVGVAVLRNMFHKFHDNTEESASAFGKTLLTNWRLGSCGDAMLVLVAIGNNQFNIVTGDAVKTVLDPRVIEQIRDQVLTHFTSGEIYQGLESFLQSVYDTLKGNLQQHAAGFGGSGEDTTSRGNVGLTVGLCVGFIALAALFAAGIVFMRHKKQQHLEKQSEGKTSSRGSSIVKTPVVFADAVYQPCSVEDPAGNFGNRNTSDEELNFDEYATPLKNKGDAHDGVRRGLSSVEEKEDEADDDNSSRDDNVEFRHPKIKSDPKV